MRAGELPPFFPIIHATHTRVVRSGVLPWPPTPRRVVARRTRSYILASAGQPWRSKSQVTSLGWRVRSCTQAHTAADALRFAREWAEQGLTGITIVNPSGESYDIDRFGMIVSRPEAPRDVV